MTYHFLGVHPRFGGLFAGDPQRETEETLATSYSPLFTVLLFSYSYALSCIAQNAISNPFNAFCTLCPKHPGGGTPHVIPPKP